MQCGTATLRHCRFLCLVLAGLAAAEPQHKPLARRERFETAVPHIVEGNSRAAASLLQLSQGSAAALRNCPRGVDCGELADNTVWNQSCWDCFEQYQELFCEKASLKPVFVDACARDSHRYRGAYCKKFAEMVEPEDHPACWFDGSEYKQIFCEKMKHRGEFKHGCAADPNVGTEYCQGFAPKLEGYKECHGWPGYMYLYCSKKQNDTIWDANCANHRESGAAYCEDFALTTGIQAACVKYKSYLKLYCMIQAKKNNTDQTCASEEPTKGMYCGELALQKNGFEACWDIPSFDVTYCNQITWSRYECEALAGTSDISRQNDATR